MLGISVVPTQIAQASSVCLGTHANYLDGYYYDPEDYYSPDTYEGVSSYITPRLAAQCQGTYGINNFSNAFIMIHGASDGAGENGYGWAQVGFEWNLDQNLPGMRWFSQFNKNGSLSTWYSPNGQDAQVNVRHAFNDTSYSDCSCLKARIDTTIVHSSANNPLIPSSSSSGFGNPPMESSI